MTVESFTSKVKHGAHVMLVSIMAGANIATIILMWATCISTLISPAIHPRLSQAGLLFPVFLGLDLLFLMAWLIVSWKWMLLPIVGILGCWNYTREYCPVNPFDDAPTENSYKILSFNVAGLSNDSANGFNGWKSTKYIAESDADIIFLQECPQSGKVFNTLKHKMDSLGYMMQFNGSLHIYSKWPFVGEPVYKKSSTHGNGSFACLISLGGDTTLLMNNHLQSNAITPEEKNAYGDAIEHYDQEKMKASGKILLSRLSMAAAKRAEQADTVCNLITRYKQYTAIVAGDMNDTPISYTYQKIAKLLCNTYAEGGNGLGISYSQKGFPVRIDHIFVSDNLETVSTYIDSNTKSSDHRPIVTRVYKSAK